jgi:hypothetical protein
VTATVDERIVGSFRYQRDGLATSPLYKHLLGVAIDDMERGGPCAEILAATPQDADPVLDAVPLRFLGGVHRLVLEGRAADLAAFYPSAGGHFDPSMPELVDGSFLATVANTRDALVEAMHRGVQTNEVGRCAALLPGFLAVARETELPLRVLEVGSSAGLNLRWDRYRYEGGADGSAWGDAASPLRFEDVYVDPRPDLDVPAVVAERAGCDRNPLDATTHEGALTLRSFVWPDQLERLAALESALVLAASMPVALERRDAGEWIEAQLAGPRDGVATVVFHSIFWQYLSRDTRHRVRSAIERAGSAATRHAPAAWLRMEPGQDPTKSAEVRLTRWPGAVEQLVARTGYHGRPVRAVPPTNS